MIEITGFVLAMAMVVCNIRQWQWGWPLSIASSALYLNVFTQNKLYGDAALQILFIVLALWGWWQWRKGSAVDVAGLTPRSITGLKAAWGLTMWLLLWALIAWLLRTYTDSDAALTDAFITSGSIVATLLLARKFTVNWLVWLAVNVVSTVLFIQKQLWLTAVLYALLAVMSVHGWRVWRHDARV